MTLIVVIGPPASGKSTWVLEQAGPDDLVIDFDRIAQALSGLGADGHDHPPAVRDATRAARAAAITAALPHTATTDVYLIHSTPSPETLTRYRRLGARVVTVDPGRDVVMGRCHTQRPPFAARVADRWYTAHPPASGSAPAW